jgi:tetratricopeptide (TPR) repeat protein
MDAMASRRPYGGVTQLWQLPLLIVSIGLFAYAAYLFVDPKAGPSIEEKILVARTFLNQERPDAALAQLNRLLNTEKLAAVHEAKMRLLMAEGLEMGVKQQHLSSPVNHMRIIEQTRLAVERGAALDANAYRRIGESYEALNKSNEALESYRKAMGLDAQHTLRLQRKVIDLQLAQDDLGPAEASLDEYLTDKTLTDAERAWALEQKATLLSDSGRFVDARRLLDDALRLASDSVAQGEVNYHLGYCAWKLNDYPEAERYLRVARDQLRTQHPLDADACYLLGRIYQEKNDPRTANSFYQTVLVSHIDTKIASLARMGRGVCRLMLKEDDAGLTDLHDLATEIATKPSRAKYKDEAVAGLQQAARLLAARSNFQGALEVMAYEQQIVPEPAANFFARLAQVFEQRAGQIEKTIPGAAEVDRIRRDQQVREMRTRAGDAYIAYSQKLTLNDDKGYGEAMWKGIDLYDRAAAVQYVISALELFVAERPEDPLAPDALLRLGRAYQAAGLFDKAIAAFQRNQFRYPQSLAASKSAVPLAQAYIAKGADSYTKAETVLLSVVDNNPLLDPSAEEFKQALFELAQLYYRTSRFEEAVSRLEEFTQRYPNDERLGQLLFLMADSYRKSASLLDARLASDTTPDAGKASDAAEAAAARKDRLNKAKSLFERVVELYRGHPPTKPVDQLYLKLAHFYRADCLYDLGDFADAIKLYDAAAFRYQDDPSALTAYIQIVNAYCSLGKIQDAKTANERAKWLLRRIPSEAFTDGSFTMPKEYWEQWLKWTSDAGMW